MTSSPQIREQHVTLGEGGVTLRIFFKPGKKHFLIRLHGDETDASAVGQWWVETYGGTFVDVVNTTREVHFSFKGKDILFDPNRVFSSEGIKTDLQNRGISPSAPLVAEIRRFSEAILTYCYQKKIIIALHNNEKFNISYYEDGGCLEGTAKEVYRYAEAHPHNLVLVTHRKDFEALKERRINTVLMDKEKPDYPGCMDHICSMKGIRYLNIESFQGQPQKQKEMLQAVIEIIESE